MKEINIFQIVVLGVCLAAIVGAVLVFATTQNATSSQNSQPIALWGTLEADFMDDWMNQVNKQSNKALDNVTYTQVSPMNYYTVLTEAIATGRGPDLFIIDETALWSQYDKLTLIPYENYPEQTFRSTFVESAEVFMGPDGLMGIPFRVSPMVMFWNRDMFTNAGIAQPPQHWDELYNIVKKLTIIGEDSKIQKSGVAFGTLANIQSAKEMLALLMLQAGTPIVEFNEKGVHSAIGKRFGMPEIPAISAVRFFTDFSNPIKTVYSWNRSLPNSRSAFIGGTLALYFGFPTEVQAIQQENPNLNFAVAPMPQIRGSQRRTTFAHVLAFAIPKVSRNPAGAYAAAQILTSPAGIYSHTTLSGLPPIRRDLLVGQQTSEYWAMVYDAALIAQTWLDPGHQATFGIFQNMVDNVTSGRTDVKGAVSEADASMKHLLGEQ